jgi:hypothetical protein
VIAVTLSVFDVERARQLERELAAEATGPPGS